MNDQKTQQNAVRQRDKQSIPNLPELRVRQIDTQGQFARLVRGHVALATGFCALDMGIDPIAAAQVDWKRFSDKNRFMSLASDARAMGLYLTATAHDIEISELSILTGLFKQQVSRWMARVEDLRENRHFDGRLLRAEQLLGVKL